MNIKSISMPALLRAHDLVAAATCLLLTTTAAPAQALPCMADAVGDPMLNCTANDFGVSAITITHLDDDGCAFFGDTFQFDGLFGVASSTTDRYDVGFYVGEDGEQAYLGQCYVTTIPVGPEDYADLDHDACGDYDGRAFTLPVSNVLTKCVDEDRNGFFDLAICTSWDNNDVPACDGPEDAVPATKSKCNCTTINTNMPTPHCETNADCATDNNICTTEVCNSRESGLGDDFGCSHNPNNNPCNDGNFCTEVDACSAGQCGGTPRNCSDGNVCTTDTCNENTDSCVNTNNSVSCNDGLFCTTGDVCGGGQCNGTPRSCNDNEVCTTDSCNEDTDACVNAPNTNSCDDGQFCNGADTCSNGDCVHAGDPCDGPGDGDADCSETCSEANDNCEASDPNGSSCDDGLFCKTGEQCTGGVCTGTDRNCDDEEVCTTDSCNEGSDQCDNLPNTEPCDDGEFCTSNDVCSGGSCGGPATNCSDNNDCTTDTCDEENNECDHENNTAPCDDGEFCTENDTCAGGQCDGTPKTCDDSNVCSDDFCDEEGNVCVNTANTDPCDDGLFCNGSDTCADKVCGHTGNPCDGSDGDIDCTEMCDEDADNCDGQDPNGTTCNDGLFCMENETCQAGVCTGTVKTCDDSEFCTDNICNEGLGQCVVTPLPNGTPCDDDDLCTIDDDCTSGVCGGEDTALADLCPWIAVEKQDPKRDTLKINSRSGIGGDTCGGSTKIGNATVIDGDVVSNFMGGNRAIRIAPDTFIEEDIVTAGAGVKARPRVAKLPHLAQVASALPGGSLTNKLEPPGGDYDLTGAHPLAPLCNSARNIYPQVMAVLDALPSAQSLPRQKIKPFQTLTLTAPNPGAINVIDIEQIRSGRDVTLELNGGGNANTVMVLRIPKKFQMKLRSVVTLTGGLTGENVLIYVKGRKCVVGDLMIGEGTIFCANGRLKTGRTVTWTGTFYGAGKLLKIGDTNMLTYLPFQGF